jgi:hypothetical protein
MHFGSPVGHTVQSQFKEFSLVGTVILITYRYTYLVIQDKA